MEIESIINFVDSKPYLAYERISSYFHELDKIKTISVSADFPRILPSFCDTLFGPIIPKSSLLKKDPLFMKIDPKMLKSLLFPPCPESKGSFFNLLCYFDRDKTHNLTLPREMLSDYTSEKSPFFNSEQSSNLSPVSYFLCRLAIFFLRLDSKLFETHFSLFSVFANHFHNENDQRFIEISFSLFLYPLERGLNVSRLPNKQIRLCLTHLLCKKQSFGTERLFDLFQFFIGFTSTPVFHVDDTIDVCSLWFCFVSSFNSFSSKENFVVKNYVFYTFILNKMVENTFTSLPLNPSTICTLREIFTFFSQPYLVAVLLKCREKAIKFKRDINSLLPSEKQYLKLQYGFLEALGLQNEFEKFLGGVQIQNNVQNLAKMVSQKKDFGIYEQDLFDIFNHLFVTFDQEDNGSLFLNPNSSNLDFTKNAKNGKNEQKTGNFYQKKYKKSLFFPFILAVCFLILWSYHNYF